MAKGSTNFNDIDEQEEFTGFELLPKGKYLFQIVEKDDKETAKGDPMVGIKLQCCEQGFEDRFVWDNIVIPRPGSPSIGIAGRTKHFLHCIGEQYNGAFNWDSDNWAWKKVKANVRTGSWNNKEKNEISSYILDEDTIVNKSPGPPVGDAGKLPF